MAIDLRSPRTIFTEGVQTNTGIYLSELASTPPVLVNRGQVYSKTDHILYYLNRYGQEYNLLEQQSFNTIKIDTYPYNINSDQCTGFNFFIIDVSLPHNNNQSIHWPHTISEFTDVSQYTNFIWLPKTTSSSRYIFTFTFYVGYGTASLNNANVMINVQNEDCIVFKNNVGSTDYFNFESVSIANYKPSHFTSTFTGVGFGGILLLSGAYETGIAGMSLKKVTLLNTEEGIWEIVRGQKWTEKYHQSFFYENSNSYLATNETMTSREMCLFLGAGRYI